MTSTSERLPTPESPIGLGRWRVAVDAFGGDNAPHAPVAGALRALELREDLGILLVGPEASVRAELKRQGVASGAEPPRLEIVDAPTVIGMEEHAVVAVRSKPDSSLVRCAALVKQRRAHAAFTLGHSGAAMAAALLTLGRVRGIHRPALCVPVPSANALGRACLLDVGANVECEPRNLLEFAVMGSAYMSTLWGLSSPRIGLLSIGEESIKGTPLVLEASELLSRSGLPFVGNVEGSDLFGGAADVVVTDGFTGNVALKVAEGAGAYLFALVRQAANSNLPSRLGGLALRPALKRIYKETDPAGVGGTPLLGVAGVSVVGHGRFGPEAVVNGIAAAAQAAAADLTGSIQRLLAEVESALASAPGYDRSSSGQPGAIGERMGV